MMFPGWGMGGWMMASYGFVVLLILTCGDTHSNTAACPTLRTRRDR